MTSVLLFRLVNLQRLLERLHPLLATRCWKAGIEGSLTLAVGEQGVKLRIRHDRLEIGPPGEGRVALAPENFFRLLFGVAEPSVALGGVPAEAQRVLATLFPREAPVYWRTDIV